MWCTFLSVVDPGTNSSGPGAIPFSGSRLRLVGLDVVQHDAQRSPPVVRAHGARSGSRNGDRGGDTVEIDFRNVAREMRLASHTDVSPGAALSPYHAARAEATRPVRTTPAVTPMDKARVSRLVAGKVEQRREAARPVQQHDRLHSHAPRRAESGVHELDLLAADARFRFASHVARHLEGGKAAILRPERRDLLVAGAVREGILPFDANLVIALVQDATRRGDLVTPAMIQPPSTDGATIAYNDGIRDYLIAVVSSMRVAALLPLIRSAGPEASSPRARETTAFAQAIVAVLLAALLLIGMVATLGA